jgi:Ca2+/Na+ antiporter
MHRILLCDFVLMFSVMLILYLYCLFVLMRVDKQVSEEPDAQHIEDSEQELAEGKLCL